MKKDSFLRAASESVDSVLPEAVKVKILSLGNDPDESRFCHL